MCCVGMQTDVAFGVWLAPPSPTRVKWKFQAAWFFLPEGSRKIVFFSRLHTVKHFWECWEIASAVIILLLSIVIIVFVVFVVGSGTQTSGTHAESRHAYYYLHVPKIPPQNFHSLIPSVPSFSFVSIGFCIFLRFDSFLSPELLLLSLLCLL